MKNIILPESTSKKTEEGITTMAVLFTVWEHGPMKRESVEEIVGMAGGDVIAVLRRLRRDGLIFGEDDKWTMTFVGYTCVEDLFDFGGL